MRRQVLGSAVARLLLLVVSASPVHAGRFEVTSVSAITKVSNYGYLGVEVDGTAVYVGSRNPGDVDYQINTLLNHNRWGHDLHEWSMPVDSGDSLSGHGIVEGMTITCAGPCAAYANLYRENCPDTYNYLGHAAVTTYHPFSPEIRQDDTAVYLVGCYAGGGDGGGGGGPGGGGEGCGAGAATVATASSVETGALLTRSPGTYSLERRDTQGGTRYLLEEWAVLSVAPGARGGPVVEAVNSSSHRFASAAARDLRAGATPESAGTVLVVEGVEHPRNDRHIPLPDVRLDGPPLALGSPGQDLVLRADFTKSGELVDLEVIHATGPPVSESFLAVVRERLRLEYVDAGRHRVVAFVSLELGEPVTLRASQTVLPLCCCYTDEYGVWCE